MLVVFEKYLNDAWIAHAADAEAVTVAFVQGFGFISESPHISQFADLVVHVCGEHLGQFQKGLSIISQLRGHPLLNAEIESDLDRFEAALLVAEARTYRIDRFSVSDQLRILSTALAANAALGKIEYAVELFQRVAQLSAELPTNDVANRSIAIASNNVACTLEEKPEITDVEKKLMLDAAHCSRKFWSIAGAWLQTQRAEYRLATSYLKAGDILNSIKHANLCLTICQENDASPLDMFYAYEAIASVEKRMKQNLRSFPLMEKYFALLSAEDRAFCEKSLTKFRA